MTNWQDLTMPGFEALGARTQTVILPLGSLEEHGPHLPLGTDTFHALEVARRAAKLCPVVVAPPLFYGMCRSTREHPGTVSISGDALRGLLLDLGREFYRHGWRNQVFISGHAGGTHMSAVVETAERLLAELPAVKIAVVNLLDMLREVVSEQPDLVQTRGDSHAGEVETAIMLAAHPDLMKGTGQEEWPRFPKYVLVRDKRRYWPGGVWGNPAAASAAQGEAILGAEADRLVKVIGMLEELGGS
jgi:creatinine amidohydrolase